MRVTNLSSMLSSTMNLQDNLQALEAARTNVSTGVKIHAMSDNPTAGGELIGIGSSLRVIDQFRRNIRLGTARAATEEQALNALTNTLDRGIELATSQASSTATAATRLMAKAEVDQLLRYAADLGNTRFGDEYIFGGNRAGERPFAVPSNPADPFTALRDASNNPVNPAGSTQLEVGDQRFVTPTHNGTEVFLDTNALQSLRDLSTALGNNDVPGIQAALSSLQGANTSVQTLIGEQGARSTEFKNAGDALDNLEQSLTAYRSELQDTNMEEAMVTLASRQTQYQAAMAATSRILGLSLVNYL